MTLPVRRIPGVAWAGALALGLAACGGLPPIKSQVLVPPPSAPRNEFYVEKPDVQSRETGESAWDRNEAYGRVLADAVKAALRDKGKSVVSPPADMVRSRIYVAYQDVPIKGKPGQNNPAHIEVRLQLVETASGKVRYSTFTQAPIKTSSTPTWMGGTPVSTDDIIRATLDEAAKDFVSRL